VADTEHYLSDSEIHPIDIVENLIKNRSWDFDRVGDDQIAMMVEGKWRTYSVNLAWSAYDETLRLISSFDLDPPKEKLPELFEALNLANDDCWTGGFSYWKDHKMMVFRYGLVLSGGAIVVWIKSTTCFTWRPQLVSDTTQHFNWRVGEIKPQVQQWM